MEGIFLNPLERELLKRRTSMLKRYDPMSECNTPHKIFIIATKVREEDKRTGDRKNYNFEVFEGGQINDLPEETTIFEYTLTNKAKMLPRRLWFENEGV